MMAGLLLVGCGAPAASEDAGHVETDAGATDAGLDGGFDGGFDAGRDAGMAAENDAGSDAAVDGGSDAGFPFPFLATGQDLPHRITLADGYVYWTNVGHSMGAIEVPGALMRCALPSCAGGPEVMVPDLSRAFGVAVDATHAHVGTRGYPSPVLRCSVDGCAGPETLAADECAPGSVVHDGSTLYWATYCNPAELRACDPTSCTPSTIASGFRFAQALRLVGDTLYFTAHILDEGLVLACPRAGCGTTPERLFATTEFAGGPRNVEAVGDAVYWTAGGGMPAVWSCARSDCAATASRLVPATNPGAIVARGGYLYWLEYGVGFPSSLRRCALADCAATVEDVTTELESYVEDMVLDDAHAYVVQRGRDAYEGSIVAVPLP
ncbi:MAG: hypothetical protein M5U28_12160 [Sandaracinaceae bacterium]|nr:hypothetical protein [Sandaracinaceae bacterium]